MHKAFAKITPVAASLFAASMLLTTGHGTLRAAPGFNDDNNPDAVSHVKLDAVFDTECAKNNGEMVVVYSTHKNKTIEAQLERYFMDVRQAGRSVVELKPEVEPVALGCNRVLADRSEQHWKLVKAIYLE